MCTYPPPHTGQNYVKINRAEDTGQNYVKINRAEDTGQNYQH